MAKTCACAQKTKKLSIMSATGVARGPGKDTSELGVSAARLAYRATSAALRGGVCVCVRVCVMCVCV